MRLNTDASSAVPALPLVGRDAELHTRQAELARARDGQARTVVVVGEAGMGKTRLCRELCTQASGFRLVAVAGEESETDLAYGVLDSLLAGLGAAATGGPGASPLAAGAALVHAISEAQENAPLLVLVDDLQWSDLPSQRALLFALRRLVVDTVCTVLCVRAGEEHRLVPGLLRLFDERECTRLDLTGLDLDATARLAAALDRRLPAPALRRLRGHTAGNPLWTTALLRETPDEQLSDPSGALPAPRSFAALTTARLRDLDQAGRSLVEVCAVAGADLPLAVAARAAEITDPYAGLASARRAGLLQETAGVPPLVGTSHALVASAVYGGLDPARRTCLHRKLAELAESDHDRLRHEVAACPGHDEVLADRLAAVAASLTRQVAWATASDLLVQAAGLTAQPERRWQLLADATAAALMAGDPRRAEALLVRLRRLGHRPRSLGLAGWAALVTGRPEDAERLLLLAVEEAGAAGDESVVVEASIQLGHLVSLQGRVGEALAHAERAVRHAPAGSGPEDGARGILVMVLGLAGRFAEAEAASAGLDVPPGSAGRVNTTLARATSRVSAGCFRDALRDIQSATGLAEASGKFHLLCVAYGHASRATYLLGDWAAARVSAERAVRVVEDAELAWAVSPVHAYAAAVPARIGQWQEAGAHVACAVEAARLTGDVMSLGYAQTAAAVLAHSRGDPEAVLAAVQPLLAVSRRDMVDHPGIYEWPALYVEALVATGQLRRAEDFLCSFEATAERFGVTWARSGAARTRGLLEAARGLPGQALGHLDRARRLAEEAGTPFEAALAEEALGQVLQQLGRRAEAARATAQALTCYDRLGAVPFSERTRARLVESGTLPRQRAVVPASRLTPQELTVACLVRRGLTNRDIAGELFLSTKTVEFHLRNAFVKLGVSSRTQLVARLAEQG